MAGIPQRDTQPELFVRSILYKLGYRYRLHRKELPGKPDIVFIGVRKVIFVHGCFWHRHKGCNKATMPKTRRALWTQKFRKNVERDRRDIDALHLLGWQTCTVWSCECKDFERLQAKLVRFLQTDRPQL